MLGGAGGEEYEERQWQGSHDLEYLVVGRSYSIGRVDGAGRWFFSGRLWLGLGMIQLLI